MTGPEVTPTSPATPTPTTSSKVSSRELELAPPPWDTDSAPGAPDGRPDRIVRRGSMRTAQEMFTSAQHTCSMRVLIVEDKVKMAGLLRCGLRGGGMTNDAPPM